MLTDTTANTELIDICTVKVDRELPKQERINDFVRKIRNPRHYRCGTFTITAEFAENGPPLEQCLRGLST
jgi:hypothetical protein